MTYVRRHRYWRWEWRHLDACKGSSECGLTRCQACKGVSSGRKTWCIVQCVCEREKESFVRWQGSGIAVAGWKLGYLHIIMGKIERGYSLATWKSSGKDWVLLHVMTKKTFISSRGSYPLPRKGHSLVESFPCFSLNQGVREKTRQSERSAERRDRFQWPPRCRSLLEITVFLISDNASESREQLP